MVSVLPAPVAPRRKICWSSKDSLNSTPPPPGLDAQMIGQEIALQMRPQSQPASLTIGGSAARLAQALLVPGLRSSLLSSNLLLQRLRLEEFRSHLYPFDHQDGHGPQRR